MALHSAILQNWKAYVFLDFSSQLSLFTIYIEKLLIRDIMMMYLYPSSSIQYFLHLRIKFDCSVFYQQHCAESSHTLKTVKYFNCMSCRTFFVNHSETFLWSTYGVILLSTECCCCCCRWAFVPPSYSSWAHTNWLSTCRHSYCGGRLVFIDRE